MEHATTRRRFLQTGAVSAAATLALSPYRLGAAAGLGASENAPPQIRLGVASYSFHKFDRAQVIEFVKQLHTPYLNAKDVKDHLPMSPPSATDEAVAAYKAAGIELTSGGVI